jgi:hypothetical protein
VFHEFRGGHIRKSLPGRNLAAQRPVLVELFAGKYEQKRRAKVKFRQAVDEQWIMLGRRVCANSSNNCTQAVTETTLIHVSARYGLKWSADRPSLSLGFAKNWITVSEIGGLLERYAGAID